MAIESILIKNFKSLRDFHLSLNSDLNIIVGNNESGKSTLLEAINLGLTGQLNNRWISNELSPFLFNIDTTIEYIRNLKNGENPAPPEILIELYLSDIPAYSELKGTINSQRIDCPGVSITIKLNKDFTEEYISYIENIDEIKAIPTEFYEAYWLSFANAIISFSSLPIKSTLLDTTSVKLHNGTDYYIQKTIQESLSPQERANMSILFRILKERFAEEEAIKTINERLESSKGAITEKDLKISLDISQKNNWDANLTSYVNEIPFQFIGKGEQNILKMMFALERKRAKGSNVLLIEEPENHLSYTSMNVLIKRICESFEGRQILITTHSAFVLNKLGLDKLLLINAGRDSIRLNHLSENTQDYFKKLPGYDTLRLILARKSILVEGPSDELIVQKAYYTIYKKLPIEDGIDVISVRGLSFKRFLEIAEILNKNVSVVIDNDGNIDSLTRRYRHYIDSCDKIKICFHEDEKSPTLENLLVETIGAKLLSELFRKTFSTAEDLIEYMKENKTHCALQIFNSENITEMPDYIIKAFE